MLIMGSKSGRLGNRLFAFGHFIANAIEHEYALINPTFDEYCRYFIATSTDDFGEHRISVRLPGGISFGTFRWLRRTFLKLPIPGVMTVVHRQEDECFDLNDPLFLKLVSRHIVISDGWEFRDHRHFEKHAEVIRRLFRPSARVEEAARRVAWSCREQGDVVVGIHIRKRDYRQWQQGRYCFEDTVYLDKMLQAQEVLGGGGSRPVFLICSDEQVDPELVSPIASVLGTGHPVKDLYALSECDFIIGPPSSFSMWASFYGKVPLLQVRQPNQRVLLEKFAVNCG